MVGYYGFDVLYGFLDVSQIGFYFMLACVMFFLTALSLNASAWKSAFVSHENDVALAVFGAMSITLVSVIILVGGYSIGREIESPFYRLVVRASLFLQYWLPAVFFIGPS